MLGVYVKCVASCSRLSLRARVTSQARAEHEYLGSICSFTSFQRSGVVRT